MDESELNAAELAGIDLIRESIGRKIYRVEHGNGVGVIRSHCVDQIVDALADRARDAIREKQSLISEVRRQREEIEELKKTNGIRPAREITAEEENFRLEPLCSGPGFSAEVIRRDPVEPEPVGTIVLLGFQVTGYDKDYDGSLMARLRNIDSTLNETGWSPKCIGLHPSCTLVASEEAFKALFRD